MFCGYCPAINSGATLFGDLTLERLPHRRKRGFQHSALEICKRSIVPDRERKNKGCGHLFKVGNPNPQKHHLHVSDGATSDLIQASPEVNGVVISEPTGPEAPVTEKGL